MTAAVWGLCLLLFTIGLGMVVWRRQLIAMLLGLELLLCAVNLALVYYACVYSDAEAIAAVLLLIAVAAAEAVVGLTLILKVYESTSSADSSSLTELKG